MISHYVDMVLVYIESGSALITNYIGLIVFLAALLESTPIIGTFTPGTLFLLLFGYISSVQHIQISYIILAAICGSVVGDILGYIIGKYASGWLVRHKKILQAGHIEQGRAFFSKHGGKSILIGRFVGPIRPIVPLIAGSIHMRLDTFFFWNILGSFLWSVLYITLGYFFGAYAREIEHMISRTSLGLVVVGALIGVWYYMRHRKNRA